MLFLLLLALVVSARLSCLYFYGTDTPYSDQWDAEGWTWLRPFQSGHLDWATLWLPQNEHRVAIVRLLLLGLFVVNNHQWDNQVLATFNALLVGGLGAFALRVLLARAEPYLWPVALLVLFALCLPCGYENLLVGFQGQIYFLVILAVAGIWLASTRPAGLAAALMLTAIAATSLVTLASGIFAAPAILFAAIMRTWTLRERWRALAPLALAMIAVVYLGSRLFVHVAGHDHMRAHSIGEWLLALRLVGSWPLPASWISFAVVWSPTLVATAITFRTRRASPVWIAALAMAFWTAAQIASLAFGRANDLIEVHSRYTDILAATPIINGYFCLELCRREFARIPAPARLGFAGLWISAVVAAYAVQGAIGFVAMQQFAQSRRAQTEYVRQFVQDNALWAFDRAVPWQIPYPDKRRLTAMLLDKTIRDILPASIRPRLSLPKQGAEFGYPALPAGLPPVKSNRFTTYSVQARQAATGEAEFELTTRFPYLEFALAGSPGSPGVGLALESTDGSRRVPVSPRKKPNLSWKDVIVPIPADPFRVVVRDESASGWLAFQEPIEIGRLSYWTKRLLGAAPILLFGALFVACFLLFRWWLRVFSADVQTAGEPDVV